MSGPNWRIRASRRIPQPLQIGSLPPIMNAIAMFGRSMAMRDPIEKSDAEWRAQLTPEQYKITRQHGTERAGTSPLNCESREGIFTCVCCGGPLFSSNAKFDSGTGWPSFYQPLENEAVTEHEDRS